MGLIDYEFQDDTHTAHQTSSSEDIDKLTRNIFRWTLQNQETSPLGSQAPAALNKHGPNEPNLHPGAQTVTPKSPPPDRPPPSTVTPPVSVSDIYQHLALLDYQVDLNLQAVSEQLDKLATPAESVAIGVLDNLDERRKWLELTLQSVQEVQVGGDAANECLRDAMIGRITDILVGIKGCEETLRSRAPAHTPPAETINTGVSVDIYR